MTHNQTQAGRRHILPQSICPELRLDVPEERCDVLTLRDPLAFRRAFVRLELRRLRLRVCVRPVKVRSRPDFLRVCEGLEELCDELGRYGEDVRGIYLEVRGKRWGTYSAHSSLVVVLAEPDGLHELSEFLNTS